MNLKFELNWQSWFGMSAVVVLAGILGLGWIRHSRSLPDIAGRSQKIYQTIYRDGDARTSEGEWLILGQVTNPFKKKASWPIAGEITKKQHGYFKIPWPLTGIQKR